MPISHIYSSVGYLMRLFLFRPYHSLRLINEIGSTLSFYINSYQESGEKLNDMKRLLSIFIVLMFCVLTLSAQDNRVKKKIVLRDGTELIGFISEESGMTKITTEDGDVFYYVERDIKDILSLEPNQNVRKSKKQKDKKDSVLKNKDNKTSGYFGTVGFSATMGSFTGRLTSIHGYHYKGFHIGAGVGLGFSNFPIYNDSHYQPYADMCQSLSLPIFCHISWEFTQTKVAPFVEINAGCDPLLVFNVPYIYQAAIVQFMAGLNFKINKYGLRLSGGYDLWYGPVVNLSFKF